jgi:hypothetical protein
MPLIKAYRSMVVMGLFLNIPLNDYIGIQGFTESLKVQMKSTGRLFPLLC